jgi:hypothetical protein
VQCCGHVRLVGLLTQLSDFMLLLWLWLDPSFDVLCLSGCLC